MLDAARTAIRASADDLFAILAATGFDAVGDIQVRPPGETKHATLNLAEASRLAGLLATGKIDPGLISGFPGVQPKFSLGQILRTSRTRRTIAKFEPERFPGLLRNEHATMRLASRCGLLTARTELRDDALVVERFDRLFRDGKEVQIHVEDMLQATDRYPHAKYSVEYVELLDAMARIGVSKAGILAALRLYAFSYLVGNGDLHAKNVSLMSDPDAGGWVLTPAYDLLSTLPYCETLYGADRMALALADEAFGRFSPEDFVTVALGFGIVKDATLGMLRRLTARFIAHATALLGGAIEEGDLEIIMDRARSLAA